MALHELSDVDVVAVSLVKEGANRQRFFLRKGVEEDDIFDLPARSRIVKSDEWSAVYCVVAEPGSLESAGMGADNSVPDRWASEDEIRKAAHRFAKNGGLINRMHESLEPYGEMVETAVALADFDVGGETIEKGTWYIAIEPNDDGRAAIEKGEFTGVSIQGTGMRTRVEKRDVSQGGRKAKKESVIEGLLRKMADKLGIDTDEEPEEIAKAATFAQRMAADRLDDELPRGMDLLRTVIFRAVHDPDIEAPMPLIRDSVSEFADWAEGLLSDRDKIAKQRELTPAPEGLTVNPGRTDSEMSLSTEERAEFDELKKQVESLPQKVASEFGAQFAKALGATDSEENPTPESIAKAVKDLKGVTDEAELAQRVERIEADIAKLAEGNSTQPEDDNSSVAGADEARQAVAKAFQSHDLDPNLAGVL